MGSVLTTLDLASSLVHELRLGGSSSSDLPSVVNSVSSDSRSSTVGDELDQEVDGQDGGTDSEGDEPLLPGETFGAHFEDDAGELCDEDLEAENEEPDSHEDRVGKHSSEDVEFVMDLAGAEHVDDLEHHEGSEEESPVARGMSGEVASCGNCFISNRVTSLNLSLKFFPDSSKDFAVFLGVHASRLVSRNLSNFIE